MHSGVYEIVNTQTGKRYIGSAVRFGDRFTGHRVPLRRGEHHNRHLQNAWKKYGEAAFVFRPLLICAKRDLLMYEQICITALRPEYNIAPNAISRLGAKNTAEHNAKIGAAHRGRTKSAQERAAMSEAGKRLWASGNPNLKAPPPMSPEVKARVDAAKVGRKQPPAAVAARAELARQRMLDPEFKRRAIECLRSREDARIEGIRRSHGSEDGRKRRAELMTRLWADAEYASKTLAATRATQKTAEWKARHAEGIARANADPAKRERRNAAIRAYWSARPKVQPKVKPKVDRTEMRKRMSESQKRRFEDPQERKKAADAGRLGAAARWGGKCKA